MGVLTLIVAPILIVLLARGPGIRFCWLFNSIPIMVFRVHVDSILIGFGGQPMIIFLPFRCILQHLIGLIDSFEVLDIL